MKKSVLISALVFFGMLAQAQEFNFGIRGGLNISSLGDYEQIVGQYEDSELEDKLGLYAGLFFQYTFANNFGIESGLFYAMLGGKEKENDYYEAYKVTANPAYLQLPVSVFYKINLPSDFKIYPALGIYAGYGLGGHLKTEGSIGGEDIGSKVKYFDDFAEKFDFGGTVGLNVQYKKFILGFHYDHGFIRVNKEKIAYGDNAYNSNFRCSLSFLLN